VLLLSPVAVAVTGLASAGSVNCNTLRPPITVLALPLGYTTNPLAVTGLPPSLVYVPSRVAPVAVIPVTVLVPAPHITGAVVAGQDSGHTTCSQNSFTNTVLNVLPTNLSGVDEVIFSVIIPERLESQDFTLISCTLNFCAMIYKSIK
jgi:hypothetical protein